MYLSQSNVVIEPMGWTNMQNIIKKVQNLTRGLQITRAREVRQKEKRSLGNWGSKLLHVSKQEFC